MQNEYISRDKLLNHIFSKADENPDVMREIANFPAADVVEVVRCRECRKRQTPDCAMWYRCSICGGEWSWETDNGFCSYGERREDSHAAND